MRVWLRAGPEARIKTLGEVMVSTAIPATCGVPQG